MSDTIGAGPETFQFLPNYANLIAEAANQWAYIEYLVAKSIWLLADVKPAMGACVTSHVYTTHAKLSALLALLKLRKAPQPLIDKVNKFAADFRDGAEARNRLVHDVWLTDNLHPDKMGKLRITADKILKFKAETIESEALAADVLIIEKRRKEMTAISREIEVALPTLPEMSHSELHPIVESHADQ